MTLGETSQDLAMLLAWQGPHPLTESLLTCSAEAMHTEVKANCSSAEASTCSLHVSPDSQRFMLLFSQQRP